MNVRFCASALMFGLLIACTSPRRHFPPPEDLTSLIQTRVDNRHAVGIALGVVEADGSTTIVTVGDAGPGARPLTERSVFEIGSITKVFTGTLLAQMVEAGEVSLSDSVSRYLPVNVDVPSRADREITLLDLATHHSGLPPVPTNMDPPDIDDPYADYSVDELYAFLSEFKLPSDIGSSYQYSNVGFGLLGHALSRAAGVSYATLVRKRILQPLEMEQTGIGLPDDAHSFMVKGHNWRGVVVPYWHLTPALAGAGALRSSIGDMMRYLAANIGGPGTDLERAMRATHEPQFTTSDTTWIGLGWQIREVGDSRIVWKDGGTAGFQTFIGFDPDRDIGVVVLSNMATEVDDIGFHLMNPELPLRHPPPVPVEVEVPTSILEDYVGSYALSDESCIRVTLEEGALFIGVEGHWEFPIFSESETEFFLDMPGYRVTFRHGVTGEVAGLTLHQPDRDYQGRRIRLSERPPAGLGNMNACN